MLFDIGVAGPLAGFVFLLPALAVGLAFSKVIPGIAHQGSLHFGMPGLQWLLEQAIFPGVPAADIYLHPVARAAWVGMFATALNLLPIGQLDGGHILYSLFPRPPQAGFQDAVSWLLLPLGIFLGRAGCFWGVAAAVSGPPPSGDRTIPPSWHRAAASWAGWRWSFSCSVLHLWRPISDRRALIRA